jgi:thioredoxin reductase
MIYLFDCAIIGGGPAGLNAALVLGRARRNTILFDNNNPRNAVTQESHGFITRDGIKPKEFREFAHKDIGKYPSVIYEKKEITSITKKDQLFGLVIVTFFQKGGDINNKNYNEKISDEDDFKP